jgi:hypothetical protein
MPAWLRKRPNCRLLTSQQIPRRNTPANGVEGIQLVVTHPMEKAGKGFSLEITHHEWNYRGS